MRSLFHHLLLYYLIHFPHHHLLVHSQWKTHQQHLVDQRPLAGIDLGLAGIDLGLVGIDLGQNDNLFGLHLQFVRLMKTVLIRTVLHEGKFINRSTCDELLCPPSSSSSADSDEVSEDEDSSSELELSRGAGVRT